MPRDEPSQLYRMGPGGNAGTCNTESFADPDVLATQRVSAIPVNCGELLDGLQVVYKDYAGHIVEAPHHGGPGGATRETFYIDLDKGEYITGVHLRVGKTVDSIEFITNTGRTSPHYGGYGGGPLDLIPPPGYEVVGFFGRSGPNEDHNNWVMIGQIGIIYREHGK